MTEKEKEMLLIQCAEKMELSPKETMDFYFSVLDGTAGKFLERLYFSDNNGNDHEVPSLVIKLASVINYVAPRHIRMEELEEELGMPLYQFLGAPKDDIPEMAGLYLTVNDMLDHSGVESVAEHLHILTGR